MKQEKRNAERESEMVAEERTNGHRSEKEVSDQTKDRKVRRSIYKSSRPAERFPSSSSDDERSSKYIKRSKHSERDKDSKDRKRSRKSRDYR